MNDELLPLVEASFVLDPPRRARCDPGKTEGVRPGIVRRVVNG
ncbi:MAG: hypothetical protein ACOYU4_00660 [Thermodesulfobacteriota bacterium]